MLKQAKADAAKADYLPDVLEQLKNFKADFYKRDGQNFELNKQVAELVYVAKAKDSEIVDLKVRVKALTEDADSRVGWYWWVGIGVAVGLAGAGAVAVIVD